MFHTTNQNCSTILGCKLIMKQRLLMIVFPLNDSGIQSSYETVPNPKWSQRCCPIPYMHRLVSWGGLWSFPKLGVPRVPRNLPFYVRIFHHKPSTLGYPPPFQETPRLVSACSRRTSALCLSFSRCSCCRSGFNLTEGRVLDGSQMGSPPMTYHII